MVFSTELLPKIFATAAATIDSQADEITALDLAIGDGDHVVNLQRGLQALVKQADTFSGLTWTAAWQKIGMTLMTTVGGASGSLLGTLFVSMAKAPECTDAISFSVAFSQGVAMMKQRGKADVGEKTMLDVLVHVAVYLQTAQETALDKRLQAIMDEIGRAHV